MELGDKNSYYQRNEHLKKKKVYIVSQVLFIALGI